MSMKDIFVKNHRTNVLPLRWIANHMFHNISMWFFNVGLMANDRYTYEWETYKFRHFLMEKIGWLGYKIFDIPYSKWGTYYTIDSKLVAKLRQETGNSDWDDFKDGIPYWHYLWSTDEETGDGWRLVHKWNVTATN